ncbi:glycerophosphodiester phosphodiesterase family protein [Bacillus spongiae]|uniref:Glycerophosphodiester phosphodiesterase family protein n=1 Tax=Bacillus spongiae TaxID=2683610 RepID=A0ABU8HEW9_9BACI
MKNYLNILLISLCVSLISCSTTASSNTKDIEKTREIQPLTIAHRGASELEPEHTLLSYERAIKDKADFIEIDLRQSKDGELVAIHDETVERTTNGTDRVSDLTLAELKELDAGKGQKIVTIEEIIEEFGTSTNYYIETKTDPNDPLVMEQKLVDLLSKYDLIDRKKVVVQSFNEKSLEKIHSINKRIPLVRLLNNEEIQELNLDTLNNIKEFAYAVGPNAQFIDDDIVSMVHNARMEIHVFFYPDDEKELTPKMLTLKVDGLITNNPAYTKEVIDSSK